MSGLPYAKGSDTSERAAESMGVHASKLRGVVLQRFIAVAGAGSTCDEIEVALSLTHQTASARVHELAKMGAIVITEHRRKTRSERNAFVYVAQGVALDPAAMPPLPPPKKAKAAKAPKVAKEPKHEKAPKLVSAAERTLSLPGFDVKMPPSPSEPASPDAPSTPS